MAEAKKPEGERMKIRGVNKSKGTTRRWGGEFLVVHPNGQFARARWLLKGSKAKGTLKMRKCVLIDGEWWAEGRWVKCDEG